MGAFIPFSVSVLLLLAVSPQYSTSQYVTNHWKLTGCIDSCTDAACPTGHKKYSGTWYQRETTDTYGNVGGTCWNPLEEKCKCYACAAGYRGTNSECSACSAGTYQSNYGQTLCSVCGEGKVSGNAATSCTECTAGKQALSSNGASSCVDCVAGRYSDNGAALCTPCGLNEFSSSGSSSCSDCVAGRYSGGSASSCTNCPEGTSSESGESCIPCASGRAAVSGGACELCAAGRYSVGGASTCTPCPDGSYQSTSGSSSCSLCASGTFTSAEVGHASCSNCPGGKNSVVGASTCYDLADNFETCPEHEYDGPGSELIDNECSYLFSDRWTDKDENEASPFLHTCKSLAKCGHDLGTTEDKYFVMCGECADGFTAAGYNSVTYGQCNQQNRYPVKCLKQNALSTCPDESLKDDDCYYWYASKWLEISGGDDSPYKVDGSCGNHTICHSDYSTIGSNKYWIQCNECAEGFNHFVSFVNTTEDGHRDNPPEDSMCHNNHISYCYEKTMFNTCPPFEPNLTPGTAETIAKNLLVDCKYLSGGEIDTVHGGEANPYGNTCKEWEILSMDLSKLNNRKEWVLRCKECKDGFVEGDPFTYENILYATSCYEAPYGGGLTYNQCPRSAHGKTNRCHYLNGDGSSAASASWVIKNSTQTSPFNELNQPTCKFYRLCKFDGSNLFIDHHYLFCQHCETDHIPKTLNTIAFESCNQIGSYATNCDFSGSFAPTDAPSEYRSRAPTSSPTALAEKKKPIQQVVHGKFQRNVIPPSPIKPTHSPPLPSPPLPLSPDYFEGNLSVFLLLVSLSITGAGIGIYKCYQRDHRGEDERALFDDDDMYDITESGRKLVKKGRRKSQQAIPLMHLGKARDSSGGNNGNDGSGSDSDESDTVSESDSAASADWVKRRQPDGKVYFENERTRRVTYTDRRLLDKTTPSSPPGPPEIPKDWVPKKDMKGRTFFYNKTTKQSSWKIPPKG